MKISKKETLKTVVVGLNDRSYPIFIGNNIFNKIGWHARQINIKDKIVIITNPRVGKLYLDSCKSGFEKAGFNTQVIIVPDGEKHKNLRIAEKIYKKLLGFKSDRDVTLVALGGGVIGDLVGFVAATYLRGVPLIQVPTTLLAQVDSSVGGKVAVNLPEGKNLIGAFYQPKMVYIDCSVLATLPIREIRAGLAEVIKYGIIKDSNFFNYIEKNLEQIIKLKSKYIEEIVARSCKIKALVVEKDETEQNERAILNFGHTIGHAIEAQTEYTKYKHGEAVALGMVGAMKLSEKLLLIKKKDTQRLISLLKRTGLPIKIKTKISESDLLKSMELDKKVSQQKIRFVLTNKIGHVTVNPITDKGFVISVLSDLLA